MIVLDILRKEEGFRPHVYRDSEGYWTIGTGHLVDPRRGEGLPREIDDAWTIRDVRIIERKIGQRISWWRFLDEVRRAVLVSMAYQLGVEGLMKFRRMLEAIRSRDFETAANEAMDSRWARQTPARARRHADALRTGESQW